ncbi:protein NRT1/ PTR FAMILY 2.7-like [Lolium rigidum]|uniref:protein NRT1/ PTR FAMILY 2.7-like n=1 Tax=Lolium rigidum TaxID=89674 RepID=UPI001F5D7576|nr:protein NRT1/ PTR FAMILY 2.7-like [Lolium rigidum]
MEDNESSPKYELTPLDHEAHPKGDTKRGGWITLPFIAGSMLAMGLAINGTTTNLQIYLIKEYNMESIDATQIAYIVRGSLYLVPLGGAILSDAYFGCFPVILAGAAINVLAFVLLTLSAALPSLRPPHCPTASASCQKGTAGQLAVMYGAMFLLTIGTGGTRFNMATMGADQFSSSRDQDTFFNWYFVFLYASFMVGDTAIVYLQDGVSWALGFGVCLAAMAFSLLMLLMGTRFYRMPAPKGSPYSELACVVVAAVRKGRVDVGARYYVGNDAAAVDSDSVGAPSKRLRFLNRAAMITASDNFLETSGGAGHGTSGSRQQCTVQQVEDLKSLLAVFPLWSSGIMLSVSIGVMIGMIILQALTMDRSVGHHRFKIPAGSMGVCSVAAFIAVTPVLDRVAFPLWRRIAGVPPSALQRVGLGHVVNVAGMVVAALVERRRLTIVHLLHGEAAAGWVTPMSVLWLVFPIAIVGIGEALNFPGNMAFYYMEFPKALRSLATAMAPLLIAMGFYFSTLFVDVVRRVTAWLPGNINQGRLDNMYWTLAAAATINFGYFLLCAGRYKYQNQSTTMADC